MIYPVILSGGAGSRLWPLSRKETPKQFIDLIDNHNLLQNTCLRWKDDETFAKPIVVCNHQHRFQVAESLSQISITGASIILEPVARNTAPAIALAAFAVMEQADDGVMLVLPADHYIDRPQELLDAVSSASHHPLISSHLVTFGIQPSKPETGYGYIEMGDVMTGDIQHVIQFVEKPNIAQAESYLRSKRYCWNSGIFLFSAKVYLDALKAHQPEVYDACQKAFELKQQDLDFIRVNEAAFTRSPNISIDYAVMEKSNNLAVIALKETKWSDIGSWASLFEFSEKDAHNNVVLGDVEYSQVKNCYLSSNDRLVAAVGIENIIVVETADAVLVIDKDKTQDIKTIVDRLNASHRAETINCRKHYAPWGYSETISKQETFCIKYLCFDVGGKTSLHKHFHRTEQVTVVSGQADIVIDNKTHHLKNGDALVIKPNQIHALKNVGKDVLIMIEVSSGALLDEMDICRLNTSTIKNEQH